MTDPTDPTAPSSTLEAEADRPSRHADARRRNRHRDLDDGLHVVFAGAAERDDRPREQIRA
jgi:hypothetical protein